MRKERRKHKRLTLNFKSKLIHNGDLLFDGVTRNISFGGTFIELEGVPQVFKDDYFSLVLLGRVKITSRVIHSNLDGIGFIFDFILIKHYEHFKNLMLSNPRDPGQSIKELVRWGGQ